VVLDKPRGETPLETLERWKESHPQFASLPASYAGRLDPMASGVLLVLLGNECKKQAAYTGLDKEYEIEVVLDFSTDTGDALGLPRYDSIETILPTDISGVLRSLEGTYSVPYPTFSSKTVDGIPLFRYALEGTLDTIEIPEHMETIHRITQLGVQRLSNAELEDRLVNALSVVPRSDDPGKGIGADFRQDVIRAGWRALMGGIPEREFSVLKLRVASGSGAYMRTLAERLGAALGTTGFALSIRRTRIGKRKKIGPFAFWSKQFRIR
jgi:tRNA pseudouridine(55) synthase